MKLEDYYEERGLDRIIGLSDGVFAFSLTLLALDLVVPDFQSGDAAFLSQNLLGEMPRFIYFFMTFFITAAYWASHHRIFRFIRKYDDTLIRMNMFLLVCIILMPFVTKLISEHGSVQIAVIIAAMGYAAPGFFLGMIWHYASRGYLLIDEKIPVDFAKLTTIKNYAIPSIFLISIPFSFIKPEYALYFWLILIPMKFLIEYRFRSFMEND
ncbi:MAG TPA: TMEM175 family protein [Methanospirillum sp.]|nr:TMEM175 family protein [Methanospirillum sp.]